MSVSSTGVDTTPSQSPAGEWQIGSHDDGWWARERSRFLADRLARLVPGAERIVDCGCGRGAFARELASSGRALVVACDYGVLPDWKESDCGVTYVVCDAARLPFRDGAFDLALALDLIEHVPDDHPLLTELRRVIDASGDVGVTVPAFQSLWSRFDDAVGHYRRYDRRQLLESLRAAGLEPRDRTYFFAWLLGPAWFMRHRDRRDADQLGQGWMARAADRLISMVGRLERAWLRVARLPAGTSLWCLSRVEHR
jgi:SAM-dependent methyltransferase